MSIELTQEEQIQLNRSFNGFVIDEIITIAQENEMLRELQLQSKRTIHYIYHLIPDNITIFRVDEAPVPVAMEKLSTFLNENPDVKELLGL